MSVHGERGNGWLRLGEGGWSVIYGLLFGYRGKILSKTLSCLPLRLKCLSILFYFVSSLSNVFYIFMHILTVL